MCFGVFDGHGGKEVADHAKEHFKRILLAQETFKKGQYKEALRDCFMALDLELSTKEFAD